MRASSLLLALALGCLAGCDASPTKSRPAPPPVPAPAVQWDGQFEVWVGRRGDPAAASSRWCYLELAVNGGQPSGRAWRPGHTVRCVSVTPTRTQMLLIVLEWQPPEDVDQAAQLAREERARRGGNELAPEHVLPPPPASERWTIEARLLPGQQVQLEGLATVERTQGDATRSWSAPFAGAPAAPNEEQALFDHENAAAPPPRLIDERTHQ